VPSDGKVRRFIRRWRKRYPYPVPWISDGANKQCRKSEAQWLAPFEGATVLRRRQVTALVEWTFAGDAAKRETALHGITGPRHSGHARRCIERALTTTSATGALDRLLDEQGGIPGWGPAMASAVLAACRPDTFVVADHRALRTLRALALYPPGPPAGPGDAEGEFARADWWPYLRICRKLASSCGVSLREVGHALRAAADDAPRLPKGQAARRSGSERGARSSTA
jgi:hypothetical protein